MALQKLTERNTITSASGDSYTHVVDNGVSKKIKKSDYLKDLTTGYQGGLSIADTPTSDGFYFATENGTYTNAGGLVTDLTNGINIINVSGTQTVFSLTVVDPNIVPVGLVASGETEAVKGGKIHSYVENNKTFSESVKNVQNRFDSSTISASYYVSVTDGVLVSNVNHTTSDYIQVFTDEKVLLTGVVDSCYYAFYDVDKTYVSGAAFTAKTSTFINVPTTAKYFRFSTQSTDVSEVNCLVSKNEFIPKTQLSTSQIKLTNSHLQDVSISKDQAEFITKIENLFDKTTVTVGYFVNYIYGYLTASSGKNASAYIPVKEGYKLTLKGNLSAVTAYCWYKQKTDNNFIHEQGGSPWNLDDTKTVPNGVNWLRISVLDSELDYTALYQGNAVGETPVVPLSYMAYGVKTEYIEEGLVNVDEQTMFSEWSRNAYVVDNAVDGYRLDVYNSTPVVDSTSSYSSVYVPVTVGDTISTVLDYGESGVIVNFYDHEKTYVSGYLFTAGDLSTTVPSDCYYIRASCKTANKRNKIININSSDLSYIRGGDYIKDLETYGGKSMFNSLKLDTVGDSITAQQMWQPHILNKYRFEWRNIGYGGQQLGGTNGMWFTAFDIGNTYEINSDVDIVMLMGGANDWGNDRALGAVDSTDTYEVSGALNDFIDSFYATYQSKTLIVLSPTLCYKASGIFVGYENNLGLNCFDYADAIESVCKKRGVHYVDVIHKTGVTKLNQTLYTIDRVHPNEAGGELIAGAVMGYLNSIDNYKN